MIARGGVALGLVPAFGYVAVCLASPAAWVLADLFLFPAFFHSVKILKTDSRHHLRQRKNRY